MKTGTDFLYHLYAFHIRKSKIQKNNIRMMGGRFQNGR